MSFRQDYIERLIQKLAEAIARALGLARAGRGEEGIELLEDAIASGLGMPLPMLLKLTPETLFSLFGKERSALLAEALRAHEGMLAAAGRADEAARSGKLAASLETRAAAQSTIR
ncbi:MAG TPA: hypothetical protein VLJ38_00820 [Polyangiaceae bacterium]|nr:hypothetical protein [Polyangiaceae bacterium]